MTLWLIPTPGTVGSAIYQYQNVVVPRCGACARRHALLERLPWLLVIGLAVAGFFAARLAIIRDAIGVAPDESAIEIGLFLSVFGGALGFFLGWLIASVNLGGGRRPERACRDYPTVQALWREGWRPASPSPGSLKEIRKSERKEARRKAPVSNKKPKAREWGKFADGLRASRDGVFETRVPPRRLAAFRRVVVETLEDAEGIETAEALRLFDGRIEVRCPGCGWTAPGDNISRALALDSAAGFIAMRGFVEPARIAEAMRAGQCPECGDSQPWRAAWK